MDDFTFEDKFWKHFVNLRQLYNELLVSFNIAHCLPSKTDKISISLFYNKKLVIEKEKRTLGQFARKWKLHCEILTNGSNGTKVKYFSKRNSNMLLLSNSDNRVTRPIYTMTLLLTDRKILLLTTPKKLTILLFKTLLKNGKLFHLLSEMQKQKLHFLF